MFSVFIFGVHGQVTIGEGEPPEKYATLQIKDKIIDRNGNLDAATAEKGGLLLPRVILKKKNELIPFITEQEANEGSQEYVNAKLLHTGLVVYNIEEVPGEELCVGINIWDGAQWNCIGTLINTAAEGAIKDCDKIYFSGDYTNGTQLNASNFMSITLSVTKAGNYSITAIPDPDNGYYFSLSGSFEAPGDYTIMLPGKGAPINFTPSGGNGDPIKINFNGKILTDCNDVYLRIANSEKVPLYEMDCGTATIQGTYILGKEMVPATVTGGNYLEVTLNVDAIAQGAEYHIYTEEVDGIRFDGKGILTAAATQVVKIPAYGIPTGEGVKNFTVTANTVKANKTCAVTVTFERAIATIKDCNLLHFTGTYKDSHPLDNTNTMNIILSVTKPGDYTIKATPDPENGYLFQQSGTFPATGDYTLAVPGEGVPISPSTGSGNKINVIFNGQAMNNCGDIYLKVESSVNNPAFEIACANVSVKGNYKTGSPLVSGTHYLEMTLNVDAGSNGAEYTIETNQIDGFYFKGSGTLGSTATQTVQIPGVGEPTSGGDKSFTISTNSTKTTATCPVTVKVVTSKLKILSIGWENVGYSFAPTRAWIGLFPETEHNRAWELITEPTNFGTLPTSIVNYEGLNDSDENSTFFWHKEMPSITDLDRYLIDKNSGKYVDIVLIGYPEFIETPQERDRFSRYLKNGGTLVLACQAHNFTRDFIKELTGNNYINGEGIGKGGSIYQFKDFDDEVMSGPFGSVKNKYWGDDAGPTTAALKNLPADQFIIYSDGTDYSPSPPLYKSDLATIARHKTYNFIWIGDSGFHASYYNMMNDGSGILGKSTIVSPCWIDPTTHRPVDKPNYGHWGKKTVSNSTFIANVIAWAIKAAQSEKSK